MNLYLSGLKSVGASFYWFGGYTSFTTGIIASLFSYAAIIRLYYCKEGVFNRIVYLSCGVIFSIVSIGAYDVSMMTTCWVLGSITLVAWVRGEAIKWWYLALFGFSTIGIYMAVVAPGNQERAAELGHDLGQILKSPQILTIFAKSIYFAITQIFSWLNSLILVLGSFLIVACLNHSKVGLKLGFNNVHPILFGLWLLVGITASVFPSVLAYQSVWNHSWQCVYLYFLIGWIYLLNILYTKYLTNFNILKKIRVYYYGFGIFFAMCFFSGTSNVHLAYMDIMTYAPSHYKKVRQRESIIKEHYTNSIKVIKLIPLYSNDEKWSVPNILYTFDFNDDDALQYARYYGIDSVNFKQNLQ
ncbi:hypothetical protein HW556_17795 [Hymenobacter sp. P5252]|uniref:DUF4173 domain-containing protein n=1 Tax=Hymenobacter terrestris TaxID=2748310 RepID=A0ABX2Q828_9BACT|nr:hypothetical protein [Hymenobacter terrestris]